MVPFELYCVLVAVFFFCKLFKSKDLVVNFVIKITNPFGFCFSILFVVDSYCN